MSLRFIVTESEKVIYKTNSVICLPLVLSDPKSCIYMILKSKSNLGHLKYIRNTVSQIQSLIIMLDLFWIYFSKDCEKKFWDLAVIIIRDESYKSDIISLFLIHCRKPVSQILSPRTIFTESGKGFVNDTHYYLTTHWPVGIKWP